MSTELRRLRGDPTLTDIRSVLNRLVDVANGNQGGRVWLLGDDGERRELLGGGSISSNNYPLRARSSIGNHAQFTHSSGAPDVLRVQDAGVTINALTVTGNATVGGTLGVTGATTLTGALTANGAVTLGDAAADAILVKGTATFQVPLLTSDIAVGAVTQRQQSGTFSGTRTVASYADINSAGTLTMTTVGGDLLAILFGSATNNTAGTVGHIGLRLDSGSDVGAVATSCVPGAANYSTPILVAQLFTGVAAGAHSVAARHQNTSGVGTLSSTYCLILIELKR